MSVTSPAFFIFSALVCLALFALGRRDALKKLLLVAVSLYFYATFDVRFVFVLLSLALISFAAGRLVTTAPDARARKRRLLVCIAVSLLPLFTFKYMPVIIEGSGTNPLGLDGLLGALILPIGISFYTFQAISYPLDLYRGTLKHTASFLDLVCYLTFFPKLLLGPITRAGQFLPQLERPLRIADSAAATSGLWLIFQGLIKKLVFADVLAEQFVEPAFSDPTDNGTLFLVIAIFAYSFQMYFDLAGYTDIVRGVSRLMGFELPINFNRPYLAASISNFWQRWHITMSSFFRDYLYFSIGGSKYGNVYLNLIITFVAIGIWHGAGWTFVVYGLLHGSLVGWERFRREARKRHGLPTEPTGARLVLSILITFTIVSWARLLFRAETLGDAGIYLRSLGNVSDLSVPVSDIGVALLILSALMHFTPPAWAEQLRGRIAAWPSAFQATLAGIGVFLCLALPTTSAGFIYAQF